MSPSPIPAAGRVLAVFFLLPACLAAAETAPAVSRGTRSADDLAAAAAQQMKMGDIVGAIGSLSEAVAHDPGHGAAGLLITALHQAGRVEEAHALGERYRTTGPRNPRALFRFGWLLSHLGENARAEILFRELIELDRGGIYEAWGHGELAYLARAGGRPDLAVAMMRRAVAARPDDGISRVGLAQMMVNAGDVAAAVPLLRAELEKSPAARGYGGMPAALVLGWAHRLLGDETEVKRLLDPLEAEWMKAWVTEPARQLAYLAVRGRKMEALRLASKIPSLQLYGAPDPRDGMLASLEGEPDYEALLTRSWERIDVERSRLGLAPLARPGRSRR